jgi:hypothetical protein
MPQNATQRLPPMDAREFLLSVVSLGGSESCVGTKQLTHMLRLPQADRINRVDRRASDARLRVSRSRDCIRAGKRPVVPTQGNVDKTAF